MLMHLQRALARKTAKLASFMAGGIAATAALVQPAQAALTIDTTAITDAGDAVATVGAAVFVVMVGIKVYKWIRRAL